MPKITQEDKGFLNMAGEFLVAAELNRRKILSAVTYGNSKSADVWAFDATSNRAARIEVKTTGEGSKGWVIGNKALSEVSWTRDQLWVLVQLPTVTSSSPPTDDGERGKMAPRFFVFTSRVLGEIVLAQDHGYRQRYLAKHGQESGVGVPKMFMDKAAPFENQWNKIERHIAKTGD